MWKKLLYLIMGGIVLLFIYNSYIKEPEDFKIPEMEEEVETDNMRYNIGDKYRIDARNVVEKGKEEITVFEAAKAFFSGVRLKGKEATVDKYKNMILTGNIIGKSKYGIDFNTETIKYDDATKRFTSTTKFTAKQALNKLSLEGDSFEAPESFDIITLIGNVKIVYDTMTVTCDKGIYDRINKNIKLYDNIKFTGKNLKTDKGTIKNIKGSTSYGVYDITAQTFTAWGIFEVLYDGYTIKGNNLLFEKKTGNMTVYDNVSVVKEDINVTMGRAFYDGTTKKMTFTDNITGKKDGYVFNCNLGELDTETEDFTAREKLTITKDDIRLGAASMSYKKEENNLYLLADEKNKVNISGKQFNGYTTAARYNSKEEKLYLKEDFTLFYRREKSTYKITGKNMAYDVNSESGKFDTPNIKKTEEEGKPYQYFNDQITADFIDFDIKKEFHKLTGAVKGYYEDYIFSGDTAVLNQKDEIVYTEDKFTISNVKEKLTLRGKNGKFRSKEKIVNIIDGVEASKEEYVVKGDKLVFNIDTENGELTGNVEIKKPKDNTVVTAPKLIYRKELTSKVKPVKEVPKNDKLQFTNKVKENERETQMWYKLDKDKVQKAEIPKDDGKFAVKEIILAGEVILVRESTTVKTRDVRYDETEKIGYFDYEGTVTDDKNKLKAKGRKGKYDENKKMFYAGDVTGTKIVDYKGKDNDVEFSGEQGAYDSDKEIFKLQRNVKITVDDIVTTGNQLDYYINTDEVKSDTPLTVRQKNLQLVGKKGTVNLEKKTVKADFVTVTTDEGDKMSGDYLEGDYNLKEFNFKENLNAALTDGSTFSGKTAKMFFIEQNDEYKVSRGEIKERAKFNYKDMMLESEFLELDNIKRFAYGRQKPKLKMIDKAPSTAVTKGAVTTNAAVKQNDTETSADYIYLDIEKELGYMERNVAVTHKNSDEKLGIMNSKSDKAILRNNEKLIEMEGNVVVTQRANTIFTDKGIVNLRTNELSGDGNINFKYKIEKQKKEDTKKANTATKSAVTTKGGVAESGVKTATTGGAVTTERAIKENDDKK